MRFFALQMAAVPLALSTFVSSWPWPQPGNWSDSIVNQTTCNGQTYIYKELAGFGYVPSNARDKYGDTLGGYGSSVAVDSLSWHREGPSYKGVMYTLPDRGWNTEGTLNYQNRIHKFGITLTPNATATVADPSGPNLHFEYLDTILLTDPSGTPTSGLDADLHGPYLTFPGIPFDLPSVNYTGDGYGGAGPGGHRVVVDSEGLFLALDGTFWVSDEYGPFIYHFDWFGKMIGAIRPPDAFIPLRNNSESFSADSPPLYDPSLVAIPASNPTGRDNNQGFEGLTTNPLRTKLYALVQSALDQEGGLKNKNSRNTRFVVYDISNPLIDPVLEAEYVVPLSHVVPSDPTSKVARQSEIHYISPTQFLVLGRDSGAGRAQSSTQSIYRHADVFDISNATNIRHVSDCYTCSIASASTGVLNSNTTAAEYCPWLDFNVNSQLLRFGVHNGGAQDATLLNEKWESFALVPVDGLDVLPLGPEEFFLFSLSDNDFITQDGYLNGGKFQYQDASGFNVDNQALVFRVKLPKGASPLIS